MYPSKNTTDFHISIYVIFLSSLTMSTHIACHQKLLTIHFLIMGVQNTIRSASSQRNGISDLSMASPISQVLLLDPPPNQSKFPSPNQRSLTPSLKVASPYSGICIFKCEATHAPPTAKQRFKCQDFGHLHDPPASLTPNCQKFGSPHPSRSWAHSSPRKCANCSSTHAVSSRACPGYHIATTF